LLLIHFGLSPFYTCFAGGILAAILAAIFGYPCLRLRGPYFCIASLCLGLVMRVVAMNLDITGARVGLWLPLPPSNVIFYEVMLALALIIVLLARHIEGTKFGLGLRSIREDEETAETIGINTTKLKLTAFMLSAFLVGIVGGIYAYYRTFIHPDRMFDTYMSIIMVVMALLGGSRSWLGPVIGAVIVTTLDQLLVAFAGIPGEACQIIFGLLLVFIVIFMPEGIVSFIARRRTPKKAAISAVSQS
jgi:branched-chain amino acid transport system permease protein